MTTAVPRTETGPPNGSFGRAVWVEFPVWLSAYVPSTASAFTDGQHLLRWCRFAGVAPIFAAIFGVLAELFQSDEVFTTSLTVVMALSAVGLLSVQLGAWSVVGYMSADLLSGRQVGRNFGRRGPEVLPDSLEWTAGWVSASTEYLLLIIAVVGVPALVLSVRLKIRTSGLYATIGVVGERLVHVLAVVVGYYFWCQLVVTSIRTVFTVRNSNPTEEAVFTVQRQWPIIVTVLALIAVSRFMIEAAARYDGAVGVVAETTKRFQQRKPKPPVWWRSLPVRTIVGLLLLGGLIEVWWQAPITASAYLLVGVARHILGGTWLARWMGKSPILARLAVGVVASFLVINQVVAQVLDRTSLFDFSARDSFIMPWLGVIVSLLIIGLLTIGPRASTGNDGDDGSARSQRPPPRPGAGQTLGVPIQSPASPQPPPSGSSGSFRGWLLITAALVFVATLFQTSPALADNCSGFSDCANTQTAWLIIGLILLAFVAAVVLAPVLLPALGVSFTVGSAVTLSTAQLAVIGTAGATATIIGSDFVDFPEASLPDVNLPNINTANASGTEPVTPELGDSWGGPGEWVDTGPRSKGQEYEEFVTGVVPGREYNVGGVDFDGYDPETGKLIDAKEWVKWPPLDAEGNIRDFAEGSIEKQGRRQVEAADGAEVEWVMVDEKKAAAVEEFFEEKGIDIEVEVKPWD